MRPLPPAPLPSGVAFLQQPSAVYSTPDRRRILGTPSSPAQSRSASSKCVRAYGQLLVLHCLGEPWWPLWKVFILHVYYTRTLLPAEPPEWRQATILQDDPHAVPMGLGVDRPSGIKVPKNSWIPLEDDAAASSSSSSSSSSWLGRWFGWGGEIREETEKKSTVGVMKKTKFLESSSDAPMPPTFEFK